MRNLGEIGIVINLAQNRADNHLCKAEKRLQLAHPFNIKLRHFAFFVQGENVFDEVIGDVTATGQLTSPRNFLFGLTARF